MGSTDRHDRVAGAVAAARSTLQRIVVLRGGAIGDFMLTLPVLTALRRRFVGTPLTVIGQPAVTPLALAGGLADEARSLEGRQLAGFFQPQGELDAGVRAVFGEAQLVVSYLHDPARILEQNVRRCLPPNAQFLGGPHRPSEAAGVHATDALLAPLRDLGITDADPVPRLALPATTTSWKPRPTLRWLAVHPGSGSQRKNWPEANWAGLLETLAEDAGTGLLLVGGEAEAGTIERLCRHVPAARLRVALQRPLPELGAWLGQCAAFLGHDSGITHLAAAVGLPVVALWGNTAEAVWRPRCARLRIVRGQQGVTSISRQDVVAALADQVAAHVDL
ncbi:MAG: glycosyltransferase family 9 protein [Verrucomicrobiota bacterium]